MREKRFIKIELIIDGLEGFESYAGIVGFVVLCHNQAMLMRP